MDFDFTEEQRLLKAGVERMLGDHYDFKSRTRYLAENHGWSRDQWQRYAEMGLLALPFSESDGGLGGGPVETMLVMEAFGRSLTLEPYFATVVLAGGLLRLGGSPAQRRDLIPRIANGNLLLAFAQAEEGSRYDVADVRTSAKRDGEAWVLNGRKRYVLHGDCADKLIVSARVAGNHRDRSGIGLFLVDAKTAGIQRRGYTTQDRLRAADIELYKVRLSGDAIVGEPETALPLIERVIGLGIAGLCAEAIGLMARAHEITLEYLKMRKQFGTTIGSFQVLQHRAVDMLISIELARSMAMYAAMKSEDPDPLEQAQATSAAKVQIGRSGKFVCGQAIQLHGAIGMTDEYQIGHYYRRMTMIDLMLGDTATHLAALGQSGFGQS